MSGSEGHLSARDFEMYDNRAAVEKALREIQEREAREAAARQAAEEEK